MNRPWEGIVTPRELKLYNEIGLGKDAQLGARPGLVIIDVQYRTVGLPGKSAEESRKTLPSACGDAGWRAVGHIAQLLEVARAQDVPVFYAYVAPKDEGDRGRLFEKSPAFFTTNPVGYEFVAEVAPEEGDYLIPKRHPSAFFGTPLVSYLVDQEIDTLLVAGCTTSGCVRATVVDAFSYNFRVAVVEQCVYDRTDVSHAVNLFDMHSKYADVISMDKAKNYLKSVREGVGPIAGSPREREVAR